jgi:putative membrane protein
MSPDSETPGGSPDAPPLGGRLHPTVLIIWPFSQIVPLAVLVLTNTFAARFAAIGLVLAFLAGFVRWLRFSWRLEGGALVIEQGLLSRQRRVIPFDRIQSVDLIRKVRHRIFGVVEVRVEAIGGSDTEGKLDALTMADADRLRAALLAARQRGTVTPEAVPETPQGQQLVAMRPGQLLLAGLTGGRVGVAAALLGIAQELFGQRLQRWFVDLPDLFSLTGLVGLAAALLAGAFVISVIVTAVVYWDFRLVRDDSELRVRRGLLEQRLATIPLRRVQALRVEENLLRRPFSLAAVRVDVAGKTGGDDARETGILLPLGSRAQAFQLVASLLGVPGVTDAALAPMPRRALRRRLVRAAVVMLLPTAVATVVAGPPGLLIALLGIPAVAAAVDAYRALGRAQVDDVIIARSGVLVRRTAFVPIRNLQSLALTATPFQRLSDLATVELQIARGRTWGGPQLRDVDRRDGEATLARLETAVLAT